MKGVAAGAAGVVACATLAVAAGCSPQGQPPDGRLPAVDAPVQAGRDDAARIAASIPLAGADTSVPSASAVFAAQPASPARR